MRFLSWFEAKQLLDGKEGVSLDLGATSGNGLAKDFDPKLLRKIASDQENIYFEDSGEWFKAMINFNGAIYKLRPSHPGHAPTHVISGVRMHCIGDSAPEENAGAIVNQLGIQKGWKVLDICTGMGYSAIAAARMGAKVTSIEIDENVVELMRINPWSKPFFDLGIGLAMGDAFEVVPTLGRFNAIIHDPPRFALAPQLYSTEFYKELSRHSKRMVHYVGNPGAKYRNKSFLKGVSSRLAEAGWKSSYVPRLQSFTCAFS